MADRDDSRDRLREKIEEIYAEVRALAPGGDLDGLMTRKLEEMNRLVREEMAEERAEWAASNEADFPPSEGVLPLRQREDERDGKPEAKRAHIKRKRRV